MAHNSAKERTRTTSNESEDAVSTLMSWPLLFSTIASRDGAGTSLFSSIPFKHATSGKSERQGPGNSLPQILAS